MFTKLNLQNSYDKVKFLTILQFVLVIFGFIAEAVMEKSLLNFSFIFQLILLLVIFNFFYRALSSLYYSYWNITLILGIYYLVSMTRNMLIIGHPIIGVLFMFSLFFLCVSGYIISSPLYYPRFTWWEYDFRFRADIKCFVEIEGNQFAGRLSDLRRGAACLELFTHMPVGQPIFINTEILNQNFTLYGEVRSKREPIIGRSVVYGVRFVNTELEQKQRLKFLSNYWRESKRIKIRNKFALSDK
ncbi:MAG TPA: PilZ domain-containing protein [Bacteriovoracaceae bacterium]|nr:PilZ domain-containing protein [Bacteriovoracaceae bacterium]